ncbi:hypothetical protein L0222_23280 [bacterium]|nr:hypothetical protein [bacterium]MCI0602038.1 hypothetical protein [bacterium]
MRKTIPFLLLVFCFSLASAGAYTVVLKNGKMMTGTLVSETDQMILFKDDSGVQYSLKKANLDLGKMTEANAPKVEAPPPAPAPPAADTETKKKARVYTKEDVDNLRTKYPELSIGEPIENPEDFDRGVLKPEAYSKRINESAGRISRNLPGLTKLRDATATAWEVAASTGKDPAEAVKAALSTEEATLVLKQASDDLISMARWQETMANAPDKYKDGYNLFVQTMTDLSDFHRGVREWNSFENVNIFRSRLGELETRISVNSHRLQTWKPEVAAPAKPETPKTPEPEETEEEPPAE